ncbi:MAG: glycoside hydrolase family 9 protein [Lachnospiraceae bacterium]|nr:glycoside hydrolase family 9 protein [Lachnospiraceae bacterium]
MKINTKRMLAGLLSLLLLLSLAGDLLWGGQVSAAGDENDYAAILALALDFFDENACGCDVGSLGVSWRGNCHTYDAEALLSKADNFPEEYRSVVDPDGDGKVDVSGGYHDAGDHVKFNLTMGFAGSSLALSEYLHPGIYEKAGAKEHLLAIAKRNADYLMKTTFLDGSGEVVAICHVVGNGHVDHDIWTAPETQDYERTTYWLKADANNTAVCGEMAAAIAGTAWLYKDADSSYAAKCIRYAKALLKFGKEHQGNDLGGLNSFYNTAGYYGSETHYALDETAMAEAWLWVLGEGDKPAYEPSEGNYIYQGAYYGDYDFYTWDKVWQGFSALMYKKTGESAYEGALRFAYTNKLGLSDSHYNDFNVTWGVSRYNCAMQMTALVLAKGKADSAYAKASKYQMDYILGNNPYHYSFLIGYGNNPTHIHHRAANPDKNNAKYTLRGALIGGPDANGYVDDVNSYQYTESALDYSGCFVLACAGLAELYSNGATPTDPTPTTEPTPTVSADATPTDGPSPTVSANVSPATSPTPTVSANVSPTGTAPSPVPDEPPVIVDAGSCSMVVKQKTDITEIIRSRVGDGMMPTKYKSDATRLASVNRKGIVRAKKAGTVTITGYRKAGKKYVPCVSFKIEISKPVFRFADSNGKRFDLTHAGQTIDAELFISGIPARLPYSWQIPAKCKAAELNGSTLRAVGNGNVTVSCVIGDGKYAAKYKATIKVKIPKIAESTRIRAGKTKTVTLKNVSSYTAVTWDAGGAPLTLTPVKDLRKIKVNGQVPGEYELKAIVDGIEYRTKIVIQ